MNVIKGRGVCGGVAVSVIKLYTNGTVFVRREHRENTEEEIARFKAACQKTIQQLDGLYERALQCVGEENAQIFEIHKYMIEDEDYTDSVENIIRDNRVNAEYAVALTSDKFAMMLAAMDDEYMSGRSADIKDVSRRILENLAQTPVCGVEDGASGEYVLCSDDIAPSEIIMADKSRTAAIALAYGSVNSHTAILAKTMNIPTVVGLGEDLIHPGNNGKTVIVDGFSGTVTIDPDSAALEHAHSVIENERRKAEKLSKLRGMENVTADGRKIDVYANIGSADDVTAVIRSDAGGIGLFRTESLYLENEELPSEDYQYEVYRAVLEMMDGSPVTIRTADFVASRRSGINGQEHPVLGYRAIRIGLTHEEMLRTQLKALLRAAAYGDLGVIFPMITSVGEVERIKRIMSEIRTDLAEKNIPCGDVRFGIMIETPAAALIGDKLAPMADFLSIGTNDLSQYTMAVDSRNYMLEEFYNPRHEAVLKLIEMTCENARRAGKKVSICGALGEDTELTERFIRMGIDELSVAPSEVLRVRKKIRSLDLGSKQASADNQHVAETTR